MNLDIRLTSSDERIHLTGVDSFEVAIGEVHVSYRDGGEETFVGLLDGGQA